MKHSAKTVVTRHSRLIKTTSKFLSYILRHKPDTIGIELDDYGWANVKDLIKKAKQNGRKNISLDLLKEVVRDNDKQRFSFSQNFEYIRANQGHSIKVDLELEPIEPLDILYHGTATKNLDSIFKQGLLAGNRHHVHLSSDTVTARTVGSRYGSPIVLKVDAKQMYEDGYEFMCSDNGVWLTDHVPPKYLEKV